MEDNLVFDNLDLKQRIGHGAAGMEQFSNSVEGGAGTLYHNLSHLFRVIDIEEVKGSIYGTVGYLRWISFQGTPTNQGFKLPRSNWKIL